MREMPIRRAGEILGECDTRLWRMLFNHVRPAHAALDLSELVHIGVDEMSIRKGHEYLTVFTDLVERRVIFATEGKDSSTFRKSCEEFLGHTGHPHSVTKVAIDISAAYQKSVGENMRNAEIYFNPFHVTALVSEAVDEVRRAETQSGSDEVKESLKGSLYLFPKNPENLSAKRSVWMN